MGPALLAPTIRTVGESGRRRSQGNEPPAALASLAARSLRMALLCPLLLFGGGYERNA
jgi:hypothetical protein